jgi:hypothetical protein
MGEVVRKIKDTIVHENGNNSSLPNSERMDIQIQSAWILKMEISKNAFK